MPADLNRKRINRNVVAIVTQVLVSGVVFFVLYRYLYDRIGVEQIGVWSLVLAATTVSRIGELGLSAGVVRFVAQALGRNDKQRAADVVQTIALTLGAFMAALLALGYPLFILVLGYFLPQHGVPIALGILPYALVSLWGMIIASVFSGGLDGCMRMDLRSILTAISHLVYLGFSMLFVPRYGLIGVVIAQLMQSNGLMVLLWLTLRRQMKALPLVPWHWKYSILKEMIGYGVNFQIISVMNMLFDPLVKVLMSKFGGLEELGYYEMANRLILQVRAMIIESSRVMVPAVAALQAHEADKVKQLFITAYRLIFYVAVLFFGVLGVLLPIISILWLGHYQVLFVQFALLLNLAWFANTLVNPAYFANLGTGALRPNMIAHLIIISFTAIIGWVLGTYYGGVGIVVSTVISLVVGSMFVLVVYISGIGVKWSKFIIPEGMYGLLFLAISVIFISNLVCGLQPLTVSMLGTVSCCICSLLIFGWVNPAKYLILRPEKKYESQ
jgi:O-antigen/teichoic acid export membrane protein